MRVVRRIESKQARQAMAVETQKMQIKQRLDKEDKHIMLIDLDNEYDYSLPLPLPQERNIGQIIQNDKRTVVNEQPLK